MAAAPPVTRTRSKKASSGTLIEKAQVAVPAPGSPLRFSLAGNNKEQQAATSSGAYSRRALYGIFYDMYVRHPVVRAAIDKKASYAVAGGYHFIPEDSNESLSERKALILKRFFRKSNAKQLLRLTYRDLDIYGESFWVIVRSSAAARTPLKAMLLDPVYMTPLVDSRGMLTGWRYGPVSTGADGIDYQLDEILHFKLDDPQNELQGLSPLKSLQLAVEQDLYAMLFNKNYFGNGAHTGVVFITKTSTGDEAKRNREWLEQNYVGVENTARPLILEGDVEVKASVAKPVEMQFLEGRKFLREEILMVLEMDPDRVGLHETSNRSVSKEMSDAFRTETIWPRQSIVEEEINNTLVDLIFGWDDILFQHLDEDPRSREEDADTYDKHQKSGRMTINQIAREMGYPAVDGGDEPIIMTPTGIIFVRALPEMAKQAVEQAKLGPMLPQQPVGGAGSKGQPSPRNMTNDTTPASARQADAVSQKANG